MTPEQMQQYGQMSPGMMMGILAVYAVIWIFVAFCMAKIGEKLGFSFGKGFVMSLIPIVNIIFLLQLAGKPLWWLILFLIPLVNIVIAVMVWMAICEKRGKPGWWAILLFIPIVNIVIILKLAFGK